MTVELLFWKTLIWEHLVSLNIYIVIIKQTLKTYFHKANNEKNNQTKWAILIIKRQLHQLTSHDLDFFSVQNA